MNAHLVVATLVLAGVLAACERTPASDVRSAAPTPANDRAPSAAAVNASPSDESDPAWKAAQSSKAGSAIGGTQGGNTTDPRGSTPPGPDVKPRVTPEATGGDGTAQGNQGTGKESAR